MPTLAAVTPVTAAELIELTTWSSVLPAPVLPIVTVVPLIVTVAAGVLAGILGEVAVPLIVATLVAQSSVPSLTHVLDFTSVAGKSPPALRNKLALLPVPNDTAYWPICPILALGT